MKRLGPIFSDSISDMEKLIVAGGCGMRGGSLMSSSLFLEYLFQNSLNILSNSFPVHGSGFEVLVL